MGPLYRYHMSKMMIVIFFQTVLLKKVQFYETLAELTKQVSKIAIILKIDRIHLFKTNRFYNCLFQIFPKFTNFTKNEIYKELQGDAYEEEGNIEDLLKNMTTQQDHQEDEVQSQLSKEQIQILKSKLLDEFKYNFDTFEKTKYLKISYKQPIQLLHLASSKFLVCQQKEARFEALNYKMSLDDLPSDASLFKIMPAYKYQREGEQLIYASDIVYFVRANQIMNKETYLHASGEMGSFGKTRLPIHLASQANSQNQSQQKLQLQIQGNMAQSIQSKPQEIILEVTKREVNASIEEKTQWKVTVFSEYISEAQHNLKCGDVIWLHHSETNSTIAAARKGKEIDKQVFGGFNLAKWLSDQNIELKIIEGRSKESYEEYIGDTYSMWIIEYQDYRIGGVVVYEKNYRFKHLSSGMYLAGKTSTQDNKNFQLTLQRTEATLFHFMPLKNQISPDKSVKKGSYVYIRNSDDHYIDIICHQDNSSIKDNKSNIQLNSEIQQTNSDNHHDKYVPTLHQEQHKCDQSVFKLYASNSNDVWEIQFVLSSSKILMNYLLDIKVAHLTDDIGVKERLKDYTLKVATTKQCLIDLDQFCNNKLYNSQPEQKYDSINPFRQKLLREQYFIDILINILDDSLTEQDLKLWEQRFSFKMNDQKIELNKYTQQKGISQLQILGYTASKIDLCIQIYRLISSICKQNPENEIYTFNMIQHIVKHAQYIPQAISCLISIINNNQALLYKFSENFFINYESKAHGSFDNHHLQSGRDVQNMDKSSIQNLLIFFMELVQNEDSKNRSDFLKFLRSTCKYGDSGININQENLFKLYKQIQQSSSEEQRIYCKDGGLVLPTNSNNKSQMPYIIEQLQFFADASFGRNYLWKMELQDQFEKEFLFKNIWCAQPSNPLYLQLQPSFCKLAMSLYIDYEPLNRKQIPQFCRLFRDTDILENKIIFDNKSPDVKHYENLIDDLISYLQQIKNQIKDTVEIQQRKIMKEQKIEKTSLTRRQEGQDKVENIQYELIEGSIMSKEINILNNEILLNSMEMLSMALELNLFDIIQIHCQGRKSQEYYLQIVEIIVTLFEYDKKNLKFLAILNQSQGKEVDRRKLMKKHKKEMLSVNMNPLAMMQKLGGLVGNIINDKEAEDEEEDDNDQAHQFDSQIDDVQMYTNPLMRGLIWLNNKLDGANNEDIGMGYKEVQLKLKICDIFDHFLDKRQDFLLSNVITFFKHFVVQGNEECKEDQEMEDRMRAQVRDEEDIIQAKNQSLCERLIKFHVLGLLPNIAKTGIMEVDEPKKENNDPFAAFSLKNLNSLINIFDTRKPECFMNYFTQKKLVENPEQYDLDGYFSLAQGDEEMNDEPIACLLPHLLTSIYFISDENLERRCLGVIMRLFNQREELFQNISKLQIIFDPSKTQLYETVKTMQKRLQLIIDRSEIWLTDYLKNLTLNSPEFEEALHIIQNVRWGFFQNIKIEGQEIFIQEQETQLKIDAEKQSIINSLKVHEPVINLVNDQIQHFVDCIKNEKYPINRKVQITTLFQSGFQFLRYFCRSHNNNQLALYEKINIFTSNLQYNIGQIQLICEIFKDNLYLLTSKVTHTFLSIFVRMIEQYGRQEQFLDPFLSVIRYRDKYIFDNQLQVLNIFLSNNQNTINHKLLFSKKNGEKLEFCFDGKIQTHQNDFTADIKKGTDLIRDNPYYYHQKLLELLLATTLIQADILIYNPNQQDIKYRDNFTISVAKLKKTFEYTYLLLLLRLPDSMTEHNTMEQESKFNSIPIDEKHEQSKKGLSILKKQLCQFFRLIHITSEKSHQTNRNFQKEFTHLIEQEIIRFDKMSFNQNLKNYMDYLIEGILPLFISYQERIIFPRQSTQQGLEEEIQENEEQRDQDSLIKFAQILCIKLDNYLFQLLYTKRQVLIIKKFFDYFPNTSFYRMMQQVSESKQTSSEKEEVNPLMKARIIQVQAGALFEQIDSDNLQVDMSPTRLFQIKSDLLKEDQPRTQLPQKTIFNMVEPRDKYLDPQNPESTQKNQYGLFNILNKDQKKVIPIELQKVDGLISEEQAANIENLWYDFRHVFCTSKIIEEEIEKETEILSSALINIDKLIPVDKSKTIDIKMDLRVIIKQFINFLQQAVSYPQNKQSIITLLKVLRKVISKEVNKEKKTEMQNLFSKLGATRMVLIVLSESSSLVDKETYRHFLMFINSLLDEGNSKVQRTIFEYFTSNHKSEVIFQRFNHVILKQIESISAKAKKNKKQLQKMQSQNIDDEDEDQDTTLEELLQSQEDDKVMTQVLKFLQNCVEGHYIDLQNYIRQQSSSRNSFNMINQVTDLLKAYYYEDRSQQMYDNMIRCLDTLNELVQGPCLENQIAVSESKFFEIASDLFSQKIDKDQKTGSMSQSAMNQSGGKRNARSVVSSRNNSSSRKQVNSSEDLFDWMISRLQMKCLVLILSLIEMRELSESNPIIKRIMRNLPVNLLQRHLVKCFKKYQTIYKNSYVMEVFDHVKLDPRDLEQKDLAKLHPLYFETIAQNGFYIFFLLNYYLECDPQMENQFVQMYRAYRKKQLKVVKGSLQDLLFGDNIIGQLVSFVTSLVSQALSVAHVLKLATYDRMMKTNQLTPEQLEKISQEKQAQKKKILRQSFDFYMVNSATIEVIRNDEIEMVFFTKLPYTHKLPKEKKNDFHDTVDRSSNKSKVQDLVDESSRLIEICVHEEKLKRFFDRQRFLAIFANYVKLWKDLAFMFTILLNLFIIGSFSNTYGDRLEDYQLFQLEQYDKQSTRQIFLICGTIMTCCSIFVVIFFLCKNAPLIVHKAWNEKTPFDGQNQNIFMWFLIIIVKLLTVLIFILKEIEVIYYLAYGALAVIGTIVHPFFFSFHLTEILIRYPTLKNVIRSVYEPRQQLFLTLILFIILVYVYGLIGYTFFYEDFNNNCDSALFCFLFTFDWTFKANGGVGGYITGQIEFVQNPLKQQKYNVGRFIYDNTSNIFLVIIMVNIVAGIIIDTFGSLREEENEKNRDIEDKCFICGNLKTTFDRLTDNVPGGGFSYHIRINHYMWNYMFFIAYLYDKDSTEYTGIEQYVFEKLQKQDLTWFPFNKARELKGLDKDEEEETGRVNRISADIQSVVEEIKQASKALSQIRMKNQKTTLQKQ